MRLLRRHPPRPQIATTPMANLAMLVLTSVMIAGMLSASRGPALRFASPTAGGGFDDRGAVRVEVDSANQVSVDGEPVDARGLASSVAARLAGRPDGAVVLAVSPDASYQAMIDAYAAIAMLPGPPRIALPSRPRRLNG
jgi:biopolymer transport protein ExbD